MKKNALILSVVLLLFAVLFAACKKEDDFTPPDDNDQEPETSITFQATQNDTIDLADVFVGITPNESGRDNGTFLFTGTTNSRGTVKFDNLSALRYYWAATWAANGGVVKREGELSIEIGDAVDREIRF